MRCKRLLDFSLVLAVAAVAIAGPVSAEEAEAPANAAAALAPAGPCAEPRELEIAGNPAAGFSVVGPIADLFDPVDVAASAAVAAPAPPAMAAIPRPGPCDIPGSGCGVAEPVVTRVNPIGPGPGGPPAP